MMHEPLVLDKRLRRSEAWRAAVILLVVACGLLLVGDGVLHLRQPARRHVADVMAVPPKPADVATLLNATPLAIAPEDALAINAARPLDRITSPAARPFVLPPLEPVAAGGVTPTAALDCLTKAIYYEAAVESETGQRAVAQVVLNRMRSPIFPHTVCGVVFQGSELRTGCQFSFTCDGSLLRQPSLAGWMRARRVAVAALAGHVEPGVGLATHYHANYVVPYWASSLDKIANIGAHIFYSMRGGLGRPAGFTARYDRLAETAPIAPTEALAELGTIDGTVPVAPLVAAKPRDRTVVREDTLGTIAPPSVALTTPITTLRADETKGRIVTDETAGTLHGK